jgi:hypothetical protein
MVFELREYCYFYEYCIPFVVNLSFIQIPPAPFNYYATVKGNIPVNLNLPSIDVDIQFSNFTYGPPLSTVFDIPSNCTEMEFNPLLHPTFPHIIIGNSDVETLC